MGGHPWQACCLVREVGDAVQRHAPLFTKQKANRGIYGYVFVPSHSITQGRSPVLSLLGVVLGLQQHLVKYAKSKQQTAIMNMNNNIWQQENRKEDFQVGWEAPRKAYVGKHRKK